MSTDDAVAYGIKSTASVVTSAAIVMVGVFSIFGTLSFLFLKEFGVGLAAAVLIDATLVRAVLLPAAMKLLGDANWYMPRSLEWLPRLGTERRRGQGPGDERRRTRQPGDNRDRRPLLPLRRGRRSAFHASPNSLCADEGDVMTAPPSRAERESPGSPVSAGSSPSSPSTSAGSRPTSRQPEAFSPTHDDISDLGALTARSPWLYNQLAANLSGPADDRARDRSLAGAAARPPRPARRRSAPARWSRRESERSSTGSSASTARAIDSGCSNDSWHSHAHKIESGVTVGAIFLALLILPFVLRRMRGRRARWLPMPRRCLPLFAANIVFSVARRRRGHACRDGRRLRGARIPRLSSDSTDAARWTHALTALDSEVA